MGLNLEQKQAVVGEIAAQLGSAQAVIVAEYRGLAVGTVARGAILGKNVDPLGAVRKGRDPQRQQCEHQTDSTHGGTTPPTTAIGNPGSPDISHRGNRNQKKKTKFLTTDGTDQHG